MSTFIQIHTLTSHSTHNLNRDDLGQPKSVEFLGNSHGRISSQCLKRAIRAEMGNELEGSLGWRTRQLPRLVKEHLEAHQIDETLIKLMVLEIASLGKKEKVTDEDKIETQLIFLTNQEIEEIKKQALTLCQENDTNKLTEKTKKVFVNAVKELFKTRKFKDGIDIAMFGRMTTSEVFENCDASVQVAHAVTTHPIKNQEDFFTAVDDLEKKGETGAGHMDEKFYSTGIFYKYATVNFDQLASNLQGDTELAQKAILSFCHAFVKAIPSGSQNSMAAHQHPFALLVTIGKGANSNLINAFVDVSRQKGNPLAITTQALVNEFANEQKFFGDLKAVDHALLACLKDDFLKDESGNSIDLNNIQLLPALPEFWKQTEAVIQEVA